MSWEKVARGLFIHGAAASRHVHRALKTRPLTVSAAVRCWIATSCKLPAADGDVTLGRGARRRTGHSCLRAGPATPRVAEVMQVTTMACCVLSGAAALSSDQSSAEIELLSTHSLCRLACGPSTQRKNWPCDLRMKLRRRTKAGRASVRGCHAEYCPCALAAWRRRAVKCALLLVSKSAFFRLSIIEGVTLMSAPQHT